MNYQIESAQIQERIEKSQRILLNCHRNPDADSVGSATALARYLRTLGKEVLVLSPSEIPAHLAFLIGDVLFEIHDFDTFDFTKYDLFIMTDSSNWSRVFNSNQPTLPTIPVIVIDNHETNHGFGTMNLLDYKTSSVCEMIFKLFEDWKFALTPEIAQALLAGIVGDSGSFQFEVYDRTFEIAQTLMHGGANIKEINFHLFNSVTLPLVKFWGLVISHIEIDQTGFVWSAIPYEEYKDYTHLKGTRETASTMIMRKIEGTKFGFVMTEDEQNNFSISFRSREDIDVATLAAQIGGGGHPGAAGARLQGMSFKEAVEKLCTLSREFILHPPIPEPIHEAPPQTT